MIRVLHIGHSRHWRGGENQVRLLIRGMINTNNNIEHFIAYPSGATALKRLAKFISGHLELPSDKPFDIRSIFAISQFVKQNNIGIINAQSANAHTLAYYAKMLAPNVKLVVHRRVDNAIKNNFITKSKYLSSRVDRYIAISEKIASILKHYGIPEDKIQVIKSSVMSSTKAGLSRSHSKQKIMQTFNWDPHAPLLGFAGALDGQKNPLMFVDIVDSLINKGIMVNAVMAGTGKLELTVRRRIEQLNLSDRIKLLGFVDNMNQYFNSLDVFVLPSRNEGLGTVLLEAVYAECAIVASDVGGISEIIIDNQTGRLVDSKSIDSFCDAIEFLVSHPEKAENLKKAALDHVNNNFNLDTMIEKTAQLYTVLH